MRIRVFRTDFSLNQLVRVYFCKIPQGVPCQVSIANMDTDFESSFIRRFSANFCKVSVVVCFLFENCCIRSRPTMNLVRFGCLDFWGLESLRLYSCMLFSKCTWLVSRFPTLPGIGIAAWLSLLVAKKCLCTRCKRLINLLRKICFSKVFASSSQLIALLFSTAFNVVSKVTCVEQSESLSSS